MTNDDKIFTIFRFDAYRILFSDAKFNPIDQNSTNKSLQEWEWETETDRRIERCKERDRDNSIYLISQKSKFSFCE